VIRDLLTPEAHRDPHHWAATFLAHAVVVVGLTILLLAAMPPLWALALISAGYLVLWEGSQLRTAIRRGERLRIAAFDGLLDAVGVSLGSAMVGFVATGETLHAVAAWGALILIAGAGYKRRADCPAQKFSSGS
jgi:hypothetical protein